VESGGQFDMGQLFQAASQMMSAQQELAETEVSGTAGGGLVTAVVSGQGELVDLTIAADAIDGGEPEETAQTIADLVLAAYRDACRAVDELQQETMAPFAAGFGAGGPGAGMPGMPDLSAFPGLAGLAGPGPSGPGQGAPGEQDRPAEQEKPDEPQPGQPGPADDED
jgi:nucleoid-associated protein EbfC